MPVVKSAYDLYGLALDQFTPERNDLVKRLKAAGEKVEAARVSKLRKPTLPAWAVNQLVRTQPKQIKALFAAGDAVARAQNDGQADKLREAAADQRERLAELMDRAEGLLDDEGRALAAGVLERVSETLRAAAIDPECRTQVKDGCLTRELQFTGLGGFGAAGGSSAARTAGDARPDPSDDDAAKHRRDEAISSAREQERQAKQDLQETQTALRQAERELTAAQRARDAAAEEVSEAQAAVSAAAEHLRELQRGGR